jgi:hypothetical protein
MGTVERVNDTKLCSSTRVTRLGEFSQLGDCLLWAVFWKLQKNPTYLGYISPRLSWCINFYKKWVGLHFGRFCHKLLWSPCPQPSKCSAKRSIASAWWQNGSSSGSFHPTQTICAIVNYADFTSHCAIVNYADFASNLETWSSVTWPDYPRIGHYDWIVRFNPSMTKMGGSCTYVKTISKRYIPETWSWNGNIYFMTFCYFMAFGFI